MGTHPPEDWDMNWEEYQDSPFAPMDTYNFQESDRDGNISENLELRQAILQDANTNFTEKQEIGLATYFGPAYMWINGLLYDSPKLTQNYTNKLITHFKSQLGSVTYNIDRAIANSHPLEQNTVLYSKLRLDPNLKVGEIGKWKGYVSTSFYKDSTFSTSGEDYDVKILAVEGVKGVCGAGTPKHSDNEWEKLSSHPSESEYLLGRNTQYLIIERNDEAMEATVLVF